jgi:hypothetical protein
VAERREVTNAQRKKDFAEQIWLNYFNESLYRQGMITEAERNRMKNMISCRRPSSAS